jgi:predicted nucleotidyltransferase
MIDEATIVEAGRRISAAAPKARIILFGSHARDEADPQSDLDLLVIEPEVENAAIESVRLHRTLRGLGVPTDVVVVDEKALKAILAKQAIEIPQTHDLGYLAELLGNLEIEISEPIASSDWQIVAG